MNLAKNRRAAGKAAKRLMDSGGLDFEKAGNKYYFDSKKVPAVREKVSD